MVRPESSLSSHGPNRSRSARATPEPPACLSIADFLSSKEKTCLRAWFKHFDPDHNGKILFADFCAGMGKLEFDGDFSRLWYEVDADGSGELSFEEVHAQQASLWQDFRVWCGQTFSSARDMCHKLANWDGLAKEDEAVVEQRDFVEGIRDAGWKKGFERFMFEALDLYDSGKFTVKDVKWVDYDVARRKRKEAAKRKASSHAKKKMHDKLVARQAVQDFRNFLQQLYGPFFRAWRKALDRDCSMTLQRVELYKACRDLGWEGDVRSLWHALDGDNSGITTLEEFDPQSAQQLAQFKQWSEQTWGPKSSVTMFRALDRYRNQKMKLPDFARECKVRGFTGKARTLAMWFDWEDKKYLTEEDLSFLDVWRPPAWLFAQPNVEAKDAFCEALLKKHGHFIKGWRAVMDVDSSNTCNWQEFVEAAKKLDFQGDVPGAWVAFDQDLSGYIQLREIDVASQETLAVFKQWCCQEFGSVRAAFGVFDTDNSGELTFPEFRQACRNYGLVGNLKRLFDCLDCDRGKSLLISEVVFLDDWLLRFQGDEQQSTFESAELSAPPPEQAAKFALLDYRSDCPGPGAYNVVNTAFGSMPSAPASRHCGAFSFTNRRQWGSMWLMRRGTRGKKAVGPSTYTPCLDAVVPSKASWSFGTAARKVGRGSRIRCSSQSGYDSVDGSRVVDEEDSGPGPGSYDVAGKSAHAYACAAPQFSMVPRRGLVLHPLQRVHPDPRRVAPYRVPSPAS